MQIINSIVTWLNFKRLYQIDLFKKFPYDAQREVLFNLIDQAKINTLTVITMQVPCCQGLLILAQNAVSQATRNIPVKHIIIGIQGEILKEEWI